jgi:hypothetical protein
MQTSEAINEIAGALSKAQGALKPAVKDAVNPHFKSKYADLASVVEAIRGHFAANGLAYVQEPVTTDTGVAVTTRLMHASGQWIQFDPLTVPCGKQDAHGVGSATTYARRYALSAVAGVAPDDDDANGAVGERQRPHRDCPVVAKAPEGYASWLIDMQAVADEGSSGCARNGRRSPSSSAITSPCTTARPMRRCERRHRPRKPVTA